MPSASRARARASARADRRRAPAPPRSSACRCAAPGSASSSGPGRSSRCGCRAAARIASLGSAARSAPLKQDAAADDAARRIDQAHDREAGHRLARAGFADQPQHLAARRRVKRHVVDRLDHAGAGEEMRAQVARPRAVRRHALICCSRGLSTSRNWSPTRLMLTIVTSSAMPGIEADPVLARQQVLVAVGDQQAERRLGDRQAEAEEGQRRLERDGARDLHAWRRRSAAAGSSAAGGGTRCAPAAARGSAPPRCIPCAARPARRRARCARSTPIAR